MSRVSLPMVCIALWAGAVCAQSQDFASYAGEDWYGLYMNGGKVGYAINRMTIAEDGEITVSQEAMFKLTMGGMRQTMKTATSRRYDRDGALTAIDSAVDDISDTNTFVATIAGDTMTLRSRVGGASTEVTLPRPKETLRDSLKTVDLVRSNPAIGAVVTFRQFEPMFQRDLEARTEVVGVETRNLEGVATKVFELKTRLSGMGIDSVSYLTEEGALLEDRVAGLLVMRLEPEAIAKDVTYQNDTIVSNAAMVDTSIDDPRRRSSLRLHIEGPLAREHLIEDERQSFEPQGSGFTFEGRRIDWAHEGRETLPITNDTVSKWLAPSTFVQSEDPRLIAKASAIVDGETDAAKVSERLVHWVYENVRSTFSARLTNTLDVLDNLEGDCTEHSVLFVGLARALGLPAREVAGLIYVDRPQPGFYFHQWAKVWIGEWIDVDPTFDQLVADATHIKLAEGDLLEQMQLLPVIGQIVVVVIDGD